ncbi:hypothetical protein KCP77_02740 [Salmonella enterica subsp. enterica]|nr:hypothetical protein KCP77_02740 [Salmonella enterica subsp. enterica]
MVFQDSDVAKCGSGCWSLCRSPIPALEKTADEVIELVAAARCDDNISIRTFTAKAPQNAGAAHGGVPRALLRRAPD